VDTNPLGADGLFYGGGFGLLGKQALAVISVMAYSFVMTMVIAFVINLVIKMRVPAEVEDEGLDYGLHGETAYEFTTLGGSAGSVPMAQSERAPAHHHREEVAP
jgi:ammonium transporter, Amt family